MTGSLESLSHLIYDTTRWRANVLNILQDESGDRSSAMMCFSIVFKAASVIESSLCGRSRRRAWAFDPEWMNV